MADAFDVPVSSHMFPEMSIQVMAALGNATWLEHMPWFAPLYDGELELRGRRVRACRRGPAGACLSTRPPLPGSAI